MKNNKLNAYRSAWKQLQEKVLDEKPIWEKEELKNRMDKLLIECMGRYL